MRCGEGDRLLLRPSDSCVESLQPCAESCGPAEEGATYDGLRTQKNDTLPNESPKENQKLDCVTADAHRH